MSEPALQIDGLTLELGGQKILHRVHLDVHRGDFVSIIGPNGAGKSSLIKCISRIFEDWEGRVRVHGQDIKELSQKVLARQLSYVPQAEGRSIPFNVFEFVLLGRYPYLSPFSTIQDEDRDIVEDTLEVVGLSNFRERAVDTLSGGERQMVFIAAALAQGANVLLLDEPNSFLDYKHQTEVFGLLRRLNVEKGITILSITHDVNSAFIQSTHVMGMKNGTSLFYGEPDDILAADRLSELYEAEFDVVEHPTKLGRRMAILKGDDEK